MKSHIEVHNISHHTDEWYEFRKRGIGGSDVGTVLGINKYDTAVRLFHEKIGSVQPRRDDNERMFWGRTNEETIARIWQYYDGTKDGYLENYKNEKIVRSCRNMNGYLVNPKYPWLFASVDRLINIKGGFNLITGETLTENGILECKNMGYWMSKIWEDGIPIYHLAQIHVYMAILETDYAEIAMLVDGADFKVEPVQRDEKLMERILSITKSWWYDRVVPAQEARARREMADMQGNTAEAERMDAVIQRYEPEPDTSEAYKDFMEQRFVKIRPSVQGSIPLYALAKKDNFLNKMKGKIEDERNRIKNIFIQYMSQNQAESIEFGNLGVVNWSERKGAQSRTFNNRTKEKPDEDYIEQEYKKLDYNSF
jgi:putative phage-type endonuclease